MKKIFFFLFLTIILKQEFEQTLPCFTCQYITNNFIYSLQSNLSKIALISQYLCYTFLPGKVCQYFVDLIGTRLVNNDFQFYLKYDYFCSFLLPICKSPYNYFSLDQFEEQIKKKFPLINLKIKSNQSKEFSAIILSDIHVQRDYLYKGKIQCTDPASCCYQEDYHPLKTQGLAGYWGTPGSNCDIPKQLFEKTIEELQNKHKDQKYLFLLGDNYGHNYFRDQTSQNLADFNKHFYNYIKNKFPDKIIIPNLGNHESHPVNYYNYDDNNNFVIQNILIHFKLFIPEQKVNQLIENGLYDLEFQENNLRIISLSPFLTVKQNMYLTKNNSKMVQFFYKLGEVLYDCENKNQNVIILSHIPIINSDNLTEFELCFQEILFRFQNTIQSIISGHTHMSEMFFIRNKEQIPININFLVPSLTTMGSYNPSYSIFHFDQNSYVKNYETYRLNTEKYNQLAEFGYFELQFDKTVDFIKDYKISQNTKENLQTIFENFLQNQKLLKLFIRNKFTGNPQAVNQYEIDKQICDFSKSLYSEQKQCLEQKTSSHQPFYNSLYDNLFVHPLLVKYNQIILF